MNTMLFILMCIVYPSSDCIDFINALNKIFNRLNLDMVVNTLTEDMYISIIDAKITIYGYLDSSVKNT